MAKHVWILGADGKPDPFALEAGYHNGPGCEVCGETYCEHCTDIDALDDCEGPPPVVRSDAEVLREFIAEKLPWTADDNWHKFEEYRTPELWKALGRDTQ